MKMNHVDTLNKTVYALFAFAIGFLVASLAFMAIAYSETIKIHWTKKERFIQYKTARITLVTNR